MTVLSTTNRISFAGNGVTTVFNTSPLIFFAASELKVYVIVNATGVATLKTITTHYSVTGGGGLTGTVTMVTAPATGETLLIIRELPLVQGADFVNNDNSDAEVAEDAIDKLTMISQQLQEQINRALLLPVGSSLTNIVFPSPDSGMFLRWNAPETGLENANITGLGSIGLPVTVLNGGTGSTTAAGARTNLAVVGTTGNETVAGDKTFSGNTALAGQVIESGVISPAQITADQNDYNPTGLSGASVIRVTSDALRNITGLQGGASGRIITFWNAGSNPIVLIASSGASSVANRFLFSTDLTLLAGHSVTVWYDTTDSRWRHSLGAFRAPNVQIFTSGSGTYNTPAGATWLHVRMAGGGGGGGAANTNGGTAGGATTFSSSAYTANPGGGGAASGSGGAGGTAIGGTLNLSGGSGDSGVGSGADSPSGGGGASTPLGGGGGGGKDAVAGSAAAANTGSGGGGGGQAGNVSGGGGGAGGYLEAFIPNPAATHTYTVGAAGTGGAAGGFAGGNGAAGIIIVVAHFN